MASNTSVAELITRLEQSGLLTAAEVAALQSVGDNTTDASQLLQTVVEQGSVTGWQAQQLLSGDTRLTLDDGRYVLLSLLGQGGMGAVYKARQVRMNRDVAIKLIDPAKGGNQQLAARFRREVEIASRLRHEHVVQAYDVGIHGGTTFLVLEYVAGRDLGAIVKEQGPLEPGEACAIAAQAASGLAHAHAQGIVHRDIKPQNILLSEQGSAKVLDLGLARISESEGDEQTALTQEGAVMGTIDYMAPEQARNTHLADSRSDIYSLGATLYFLLAGRPPFSGGSAADKLLRLSTEAPTPLAQLRPGLPHAVVEVVDRALQKKPADRFQTMEDLIRALQPLSSPIVRGRPALSASVQAAVGNFRQFDSLPTVAGVSFVPSDDSATTLVRRPKRSSRVGMYCGIGGVAVIVLGALIAWRNNRNTAGDAVAAVAAPTVTAAPKPPAAIREELETFFYGDPHDMSWSPNNEDVAIACSDGYVRIYSAVSRQCLRVYDGHSSAVSHVAWSPEGTLIASRERSPSRIHIWEARTGKLRSQFDVATIDGWCCPLAWSRQGDRLVYAGQSLVAFTDVESRREEHVTIPAEQMRIYHFGPAPFHLVSNQSADAAALVTPHRSAVLASARESQMTSAHWVEERGQYAGTVRFRQDGTAVIATPGEIFAVDPHTGAEVDLPYGWSDQLPPPASIAHLAFDRDARQLLVVAIDSDTEQILSLVDGTVRSRPRSLASSTYGRVDSPDLSRAIGLISGDVSVAQAGRVNRVASYQYPAAGRPVATEIEQLVGRRYLCLNRSQRLCIDLQTGQSLPPLPPHSFLRDDASLDFLVGARVLRYPAVDQVSSGRFSVVCTLEGADGLVPTFVGWSQDGGRLFVYDHQEKRLRGWEVATGKQLFDAQLADNTGGYNAEQTTLAVAPDGRTVLLTMFLNGGRVARETPDGWIVESHTIRTGPNATGLRVDGSESLILEWEPPRPGILRRQSIGSTKVPVDVPVENPLTGYLFHTSMDISPDGLCVSIGSRIHDIDSGAVRWTLPTFLRNRGAHVNEVGRFLTNELILVNNHNHYQVWNWKRNQLELDLILIHGKEWACIDRGGNYSASSLADGHLRLLSRTAGKPDAWLTPGEYAKQTGWRNDPAQVGVELGSQ
jgi:WD40 repeat protein/tRNA A-37 threonylcarbamoyl transferase component Bud32